MTTPTDPAIEALARELTDDDWRDLFTAWGQFATMKERRDALIAYLDEVWAGLTVGGEIALRKRWSLAELRDLYLYDAREQGCELTPLGRAVLRRAKEADHG